MSFNSLGLPNTFIEILSKNGINDPYPIQIEAIPAILEMRDLLGIAQTGSGKTLSYILPILTQVQKLPNVKNRHVIVLILVPTRELAMQVKDVLKMFNDSLSVPVKSLAVFGGVSINPQMIALQNVKILIATPGRLIDLVESRAVNLSEVSTLVLDEADKILNLGFRDEVDKIFSLLPKKRQNLLFSATLSPELTQLNKMLLYDPKVIRIEPQEDYTELIKQTAYLIPEEKKGPLLRFLIKTKNINQVIVFVSSTYRADNVTDKLKKNGIQAMAMHSKKSQGARTEALSLFKSGKLNVLVATDLVSRGIDIKFLPFVINYELPRSPKDYIHRIGRTGRAEASGDAISLISPDEFQHFKVIQKKMGIQVELIDGDTINLHGF
jgi:ATP-dependent RNA helicase RhlE